MSWSFLIVIFLKMGLCRTLCNWIKVCISLFSFSILINCSLEGFFVVEGACVKGILSLFFLFKIVMEGLSRLMTKSGGGGCKSGLFFG